MELISNIITLKTTHTSASPLKKEEPKKELAGKELEELTLKMQNILNHMEAIWEINHGAVELRDKFHLLRCYLGYINRYYERYRLP
jgi:hypothetical protein